MGVGGQRHALAAFNPGKDVVPIVQEAGWAPGPVWIGAENLTPTGIRFPDLPACSESLYRLSYPGPHPTTYYIKNSQTTWVNTHLKFLQITTHKIYIFKNCFQKQDQRVSYSADDETSSLLEYYITSHAKLLLTFQRPAVPSHSGPSSMRRVPLLLLLETEDEALQSFKHHQILPTWHSVTSQETWLWMLKNSNCLQNYYAGSVHCSRHT